MRKKCLSFKIGKAKKNLICENTFKVGKVRSARKSLTKIRKIK
jgi:hypothetical protein